MSLSSSRALLVWGLALLLSACASSGGRVSSMQEPGIDVRSGQSWTWQAMPHNGPGDPRVDNDIVLGALRRGIATALAERGLTEAVPGAAADWRVAFRVGLRDRTETREQIVSPPPRQRVVCGPRGCLPVLDSWGWYGQPVTTTRTIEYVEGGVMLDVFDARTDRLVWRGTIEDRLEREGLPPQVKIDNAMRKLLASLPVTP
jgi:Domain of unknown function (DUF4136)